MILFLLLVFASWSAFAEVVCVKQNDFSWICSGTGGGGSEYPPGLVITNGLGVCTNCVNMTPERCESVKSGISSSLNELEFALEDNIKRIGDIEKEITDLKTDGDSFRILSYTSSGAAEEGFSSVFDMAHAQPQDSYYTAYTPGSTSTLASYRGIANNSIANYYKSAVAPVLDSVLNSLGPIKVNANDALAMSQGVWSYVNRLDCSTCNLGEVSGGGSGGGTGGGSGGGSSGGCPCIEQMQALADVVAQQKILVEACSYSLTNLDSNVDKLYQAFDTYRVSVTNSLSRIDSFVTSDLANSMHQLTNSLVVIERNVDGVQRDFYQAMSNAQHFVSLGDKEWDPVEISTNFFEVGEYKDLPWASRVEALLLNLTQPFDSSSTPDGVTKETMDEVVEKVSELQSAVDPASLSSAYSTQFDKVQRAFSSFNGLFQGDSTGTLNFGKIGDHDLTFQLDASVVGVCRTVFSLIWYCTALVALFFIVPFLWSLSLGSFKFLWHLLTLLVK